MLDGGQYGSFWKALALDDKVAQRDPDAKFLIRAPSLAFSPADESFKVQLHNQIAENQTLKMIPSLTRQLMADYLKAALDLRLSGGLSPETEEFVAPFHSLLTEKVEDIPQISAFTNNREHAVALAVKKHYGALCKSLNRNQLYVTNVKPKLDDIKKQLDQGNAGEQIQAALDLQQMWDTSAGLLDV